MDNENNNGNVITAEAVEQLRAELETARTQAGTAVAEATAPLNERIAALETELNARSEELTTVRTQLTEREQGLASLTADRDGAVTAYRELVQKTNPVIPAELITGGTIAEITAAVDRANALVGHIRTKVEEELKKNSFPAGAPGRTEPDPSAMSPREKITYGLQKSRKA